ncbi:MAG: hypothetical protein QM756_29960 [Polyangiaceae bacterium]
MVPAAICALVGLLQAAPARGRPVKAGFCRFYRRSISSISRSIIELHAVGVERRVRVVRQPHELLALAQAALELFAIDADAVALVADLAR